MKIGSYFKNDHNTEYFEKSILLLFVLLVFKVWFFGGSLGVQSTSAYHNSAAVLRRDPRVEF